MIIHAYILSGLSLLMSILFLIRLKFPLGWTHYFPKLLREHCRRFGLFCALCTKLAESGVAAVNMVYPWTEHVSDAVFPKINPAAQSAMYDVDRYLALLLNKD